MLGRPLMEWQQHVADVILEIDPDTGRLVYDEWIVLTPRQSGKSTFLLAKSSHRALATKFFGPRQRIVYTAQSRLKAKKKWREDYVEGGVMAAPKLRDRAVPNYSGGAEHLRWDNGSQFGIESNTEKAGHGDTLDEAYLDEAFAHVDNRLEQAFEPAMLTRSNHQVGVVSTAGWLDTSPYLYAKVLLGRRLVARGVRRGTAYFEWSAPEDADPSDERVWLTTMPALHRPDCGLTCTRHTQPIESVRSAWTKAKDAGKVSDFCRAYLNMWRPKPRETETTALGDWAAAGLDPSSVVAPKPLAIGVSGALDRSSASIGSAGRLADGRMLVGAVDRRDGTTWLTSELLRLQRTYGVPVVADEKGPLGDLIPVWEAAGVVVTVGKLDDYVTACAAVFDAVGSGGLVHPKHPDLDASVAGAKWRNVGDRRVFGRRQSDTDVAMLEAVSWAAWAGGLRPTPPPKRSVYEERGLDVF